MQKNMTELEIKSLASAPSKRLIKWSWVGIAVAIICINTPLVELGYWIFGSSLTWLGFMLNQSREFNKHIRFGEIKEIDSDGRITIELDGIQIKAASNQIIESKIAPGHSLIKGTAIIFKSKSQA